MRNGFWQGALPCLTFNDSLILVLGFCSCWSSQLLGRFETSQTLDLDRNDAAPTFNDLVLTVPHFPKTPGNQWRARGASMTRSEPQPACNTRLKESGSIW